MSFGEPISITRRKDYHIQERVVHENDVMLSAANRRELGKAKSNMKAKKALKAFYENNGMDYTLIESVEFYHYKEVQ